MGMGIAYGTNGVTDFNTTPLYRQFALGHPICVKIRIGAHDAVAPFIPHLFFLFVLSMG